MDRILRDNLGSVQGGHEGFRSPTNAGMPFALPANAPTHAPLLIGKIKADLRNGVKNILVTGGAGFM